MKKSKKKNGFTLIELLVTIAIISILSIVTGVIVVNLLNTGKEKSNKVTYTNIKTAALSYTTEFKTNSEHWYQEKNNNGELTGNEFACTTIQQLINKGFLKNNLVDAETGKKIDNNTMIKITRDANKVLSSGIKQNAPECDNTKPGLKIEVDGPFKEVEGENWYYDSEKTIITIQPILNGAAGVEEYLFYVNDEKQYSVESSKEEEKISLSEILTNPLSSYGENVKVCGKILNTNGVQSDEMCDTINVDFTTPTKPTLTASDNIDSGKWHKGEFKLNISGETSSPSGNFYEYNTDGGNAYTKLDNNIITNINSPDTTYYVRNCNNVGKCSEDATYHAKVDNNKPEILSFTKNTEETARELTLTANIKDELSGIVKYKITTESSYTDKNWTKVNATNNTLTATLNITSNNKYYVWVEDAVGNYNKSELNITNIDREGPVYKSGGTVSLGSVTSATFTDVSTPVTVYYQVTTTSSQPSSSSFTSTTRTFNTECGKTYYVWAKAVDRLGNYTIKKLGEKSSAACCSEGTYEDYECTSNGYVRQRRYNECESTYQYQTTSTSCKSSSSCGDWGECQSSGVKYRICTYYEGGVEKSVEEETTCEYSSQNKYCCSHTYNSFLCLILDPEKTGYFAECYGYDYYCPCS